MNNYYWTEEEKTFLKENYRKMPCKKIAKRLRRTESAVWVQARKIGVARKKGEIAAAESFGKNPEISFKVKPKAEKPKKEVKANPEKNIVSILTDVIIGLSVTTIILALILFVMFVR